MIQMTSLKVPPEQAIRMLIDRLNAMTSLNQSDCEIGYYDLLGWCSQTWAAVDTIFGSGDYRADEIRLVGVPPCKCCGVGPISMQMETYFSYLQRYIQEIEVELVASQE
jgi:hypothetical protein